MQISRDYIYAVTRRIKLKLNIALYSKSLNPTIHISPPNSIGSVLGLTSKGHSFDPAVNHYFFFQQYSLVGISVFTGEDQQSEWLKGDKWNKVYWFETGFVSLVYL